MRESEMRRIEIGWKDKERKEERREK